MHVLVVMAKQWEQQTRGHAICPRCGHGVERFPCWQCGYPAVASHAALVAALRRVLVTAKKPHRKDRRGQHE